tara:strand:+ start:743 stop:958 length:216 start_codon:yes stop_codon:yes gene_type:complete
LKRFFTTPTHLNWVKLKYKKVTIAMIKEVTNKAIAAILDAIPTFLENTQPYNPILPDRNKKPIKNIVTDGK